MQEFEPSWLANAIPRTENVYDRCERYSSSNNYTDVYGENSIHILFNDTCPTGIFKTNETVKCNSWVYGQHHTIVSEFDLGCNTWKRAMLGTMNNAGQFIGLPVTGFISDRYGRKIALVVASVLSGIFGQVKSLSPDYYSLLFLEFLEPVVGSGVYSSAYILGIEMMGASYRIIGTTLLSTFFACGEMLLGLVSWYYPYWRVLLRIIYAPPLLLIFYIWLLPESVRWLLIKKKTIMAADILKRAAKVNGKVLSDSTLKTFQSCATEELSGEPKKKGASILAVFRSKILIVRLAFCSFWWATCTFVYYGLSQNSVEVAGNANVNYILVSMIEIPAYIAYYFCMNRFGRRTTLSASWLGSGLACILSAFLPIHIGWLKLVIFLFGKFSITVAFTAIYIYTAELFPTSNRHALQSVCSMFGRVGSIIAPQTPILSLYFKEFPLILFAVSSIISGLSVLAFPETSNVSLPDTIEDAENLGKKKVISSANSDKANPTKTINPPISPNPANSTSNDSNPTRTPSHVYTISDPTYTSNSVSVEYVEENTRL